MTNKSTDPHLEQMLRLTKHEELISFCLHYAKGNTDFNKDLTSYLSNKYIGNKKTTEDYRKKIKTIFSQTKNVGSRWDSFYVTDWDSILRKADKLIKEGRNLLDLGNADAAANLATEFFVSFHDHFDENEYLNAQDEDHFYSDSTCNDAQQLLLDAIDHPNLSSSLQKNIIAELNNLTHSAFADELKNDGEFDYNAMMLQVSAKTQSDEDTLQMLNEQIIQHEGKYDHDEYVKRKIELLEKLGRNQEAEETEYKYIHLSVIRKLIVDRRLSQGKYSEAIKLVNDGIEEGKRECHRGIVYQWKEVLLDIYCKQDDKSAQIDICHELFAIGVDPLKYYRKLKALIPTEQWNEYLNKLITDTENNPETRLNSDTIAKIYIEEKDAEHLFQHIIKPNHNLWNMLDNYSYFIDEAHADELLTIYTRLLKNTAEQSINARSYHAIAHSMNCMLKLKNGKAAAHQLAIFFREQYRRRTAMMKEIEKF